MAIQAGKAVAALAVALVACTSSPAPQKSPLQTTRAFDSLFGELPPMAVPGPSNATVVYFPSVQESGKYRPVPIFTAERGKEERLSVRTAVRGVDVDGFDGEVSFPFPKGADLDRLDYEGGVARVAIGGTFRAADLSEERRSQAAGALALTIAQFGKAAAVDVTDAAGIVHFRAGADQGRTADLGPPKVLGLLAIREEKAAPPSVLSVLFDRPVFVEDISFSPADGKIAVPGKIYSTGFGMTVELHPDPKVEFDGKRPYRVRTKVRDGKGRRMFAEITAAAKVVTRE